MEFAEVVADAVRNRVAAAIAQAEIRVARWRTGADGGLPKD
jgi:hypothetical protein